MVEERKRYLKQVKRVVVKVGSSTLTHSSGRLNLQHMEALVHQLADLHNRGLQVILVTSGAVGAGIGKLGLKRRPRTIPEKQAAAAVGQGILLHMYEKLFAEYGQTVAQILLTREDVAHRSRFLNARNALFTLLKLEVIPIINENDAVAVEEIKFGDNDTLSALVASLVEADLLILLSDIAGLYEADPRSQPDARLLNWVAEITPEIEAMAGGAGTQLGTGGMATKIQAAKIAVSSGTAMVIADGSRPGVIQDILAGEEVGTWFKPQDHPLQARKRWIAFSPGVKGRLVVDDGAVRALVKGRKSLLASGLLAVEGSFSEGQVVTVVDREGREIARGLVNYSATELEQIKGLKTEAIERLLGHKNYDEVIHRDNLVVL
ncbi:MULTISPECIES: glutamate 5-kinase [Carboxydocella]|uniref:Glutamate 5-kinase n=2 Tax=Carboxydocella TaxID=178898 RepID=A0A1T4L4I9_9FIRM|nr:MULTISPECIES: glutamate 5-kinase [Carboxydocella]AVX19970.1 glutamate 5-kinase [Carboxydocella thermautotrophica]AVX30392.1 glutamate 5-kinase [Carboxydocella thermautotrophica]SJZ49626.1 glutamate 5-kinase [Carboxydocella sporoproducens DSM 16521]GAW28025.1 glutamate 5-kinase [Carboxydocella sp. ULO1]GAW32343.1 glutamate 5-kinase [Carboxydocella sp. JDF658]